MTASEALAWSMSVFGAVAWWLYGNKSRWGCIVGLVHQVVVAIYAILCQHWGLLPGVALYVFVHLRNWRKWAAAGAGPGADGGGRGRGGVGGDGVREE